MTEKKPAAADSSRPRRWLLWAIAGVVIVGAGGVYLLSDGLVAGGSVDSQPTYRVHEGPLVISVVESGTIKSLEQVSLKSEVEGMATIIYLIPEGTEVKKGDLLVELDASTLQDNLIQQQISVDNAEASYVSARESLAVARNQAASDISQAELNYRFAQEDVKQYTDGTHPQEVKEAETNITLAYEELQRAIEELTASEKLYSKKYISQTELEADRLTKKRAELNHELAVASLELLEKYTSPRKLDELKSDVEQMRMALERTQLQANADVVQAEAQLKAKEREYDQQRTKLEKYERQIEHTKIYAPRSGLVVYATSVQMGRGPRRSEPLEEGQSVRERQHLIYLPSADSMMAEIQIHESSLEKARVGLPVRISVDALPGVPFTGRVAKIAPLPDAESAFFNPDLRVYPCEIHLNGTHPELRTGMSCQAEVVVEQYTSTLYVPVQAVVRVGNQPTVYVRNGDDFEPQSVEIGLDNNSLVHVLSGIEPGQDVLLTPPLESTVDTSEGQTPMTELPVVATESLPAGGAESGAVSEVGGLESGEMPARPEGGPNAGGAGGFPRGGRNPFENMSEEDREKMRERFRNMSPEEREQMRKRFGRPGGGSGRARRRSPGSGEAGGGAPQRGADGSQMGGGPQTGDGAPQTDGGGGGGG